MMELLQANWWLLVIALLIGIVVAWWVLVASRKTTIEREEKSAEDIAAKRNQALIDAPPVAAAGGAAPIAPLPPMTTVPETLAEAAPQSEPAPAPSGAADDLTRIKGIGPKLVAMLAEQGITSFAQVASWDDAAIDRIDAGLGRFKGRIRRDNWVEQARLLAADNIAGYEDRFGKI